MATVKQHYAEVLADVYSWMQGGFEEAIANLSMLTPVEEEVYLKKPNTNLNGINDR